MKVGDVINKDNEIIGYLITSPASRNTVCLYTKDHVFNGNYENPSFTGEIITEKDGIKEKFTIKNGMVTYADAKYTSHSFAGMTVEMIDVDENYDYYEND